MTLGDLANVLGLSKATVSYALRGSAMVSARTQKHVQLRARELGYSPNPVASVFLQQIRSQGKRRYQANLAFLVPETSCSFHTKSIQDGARERAGELGYGMEIIPCTRTLAVGRLNRLLSARGIMGIAIGPLQHAVGHLTLDWSGFSCVSFGYSMIRPSVHRVVHHHVQGIGMAFRMCRRKGFRRIGFLMSSASDLRSNRLWSSCYMGLQRMLPKSDQVSPMIGPYESFSRGGIKRWILTEKVDVILMHALGCFPDLELVLKDIPFQVCRVVLDREPGDSCAGVDQQFHLSGRLLVDSLSTQILHNQRGIPSAPIVSMVEGVWINHPSLVAPLPVTEGKARRF